MSTALRTARLSGTVYWDDDESLFDGWLLIGLNSGGDSAPKVYLDNALEVVELPSFTKFRVTEGVIDQDQELFFTSDIQPPNSRYWAWWYDLTGTLIAPAGDPSAFTVTANPHPITIPTLTSPTAPTDPPSTTTLLGSTVAASVVFVDGVTPTGTINSTTGSDGNGVFTLPSLPNPTASLTLVLNGVVQIPGGVDFTLSSTTITFVSGKYPTTDSTLRAYYRRLA